MAYSETGQNRIDRFAEEWAEELPQNEAYELANFLAGFARDRATGKRPSLWEFDGPMPTKAISTPGFYEARQSNAQEVEIFEG